MNIYVLFWGSVLETSLVKIIFVHLNANNEMC